MPNRFHSSPPSATGARIVGKGESTAAGPGPAIMAASTLDSDRVLGSDNQEIGKIKEIMLDVEGGRIAYAVMSSGGFLGIGDKLFAIPWGALTLDTSRKCFLLNVPSEQVKDAPGFNKDQWPSMADLGWATTVHEYYGADPYWNEQVVVTGREVRSDKEPPEAGGVKL
jgi:sporulation protein YlmC with PRC-barrel domain